MLYQLLLAVGVTGLIAQAFLGLDHHDGGDGHTDHGNSNHTNNSEHSWLLFLSPLRLFGFLIGVGGSGLLLQVFNIAPWLIFLIAMLLGVVFFRLVIKPLMAVTLRFASKPAETLVGAMGKEAVADSRFDASGHGIVVLAIDGQRIRLLATLDGDPQPVESGEKLLIVGLDLKKNTCMVTKL
jgi:hypothetical protein